MENTFSYKYSADENLEVQLIRKKYLPREESKLEELKRLDYTVQTSGMTESLTVGIGGALIFSLGLCFAMQVIGNGVILIMLGILLGIVGITGMLLAYPIQRKIFAKTKEKFLPRILELTEDLSTDNIQ